MANAKPDCEVFEVRVHIEKETGRIYDVEPIDPEKYTCDEVNDSDLPKEAIREAYVMLFSQNSPGCLEWRTVLTPRGFRRICVRFG